MKLLYDLEIMDMGEETVAVPVGDSAQQFHGMLRMNAEAAQMLRQISESSTPEEVLEKLCRLYPEEDRNKLGQTLCDFLNQLIREGILQP